MRATNRVMQAMMLAAMMVSGCLAAGDDQTSSMEQPDTTSGTLTRTIIVPVQPPATLSANVADLAAGVAGNIGDPGLVLFAPLALPTGTLIRNWRVRVRDGGGGTMISSRLVSTDDTSERPNALWQSTASGGIGAEQTIAANGVALTTAPATAYALAVFNISGQATGRVFRIELDTN